VIFDLDGVLIDSEPSWRDAEVEVLGARGVPLTHAMCRETTGLRIDAVVAHWRARYPFDDAGAVEAIEAGVVRRLLAAPVALPGVAAAVSRARNAGKVGLASSSSRHLVDAALAGLGLTGAFDALTTGDEVRRPKPDPEIYLLACRRLGVDPADALAVEDSIHGVRAAKSAGLTVVAVPGPESDRSAIAAIADRVVDGLDAVGFA
jgi:HAD superfamily hydrolase (TIGR01509 family)